MPSKKTFFSFLEEGKILKGREGNRPTSACPLYYFSFVFCFLSYVFLFPCFLTFFLLHFSLVFFPCFFPDPCSRHSGGLFIAPAVTRFDYFALEPPLSSLGVPADHY